MHAERTKTHNINFFGTPCILYIYILYIYWMCIHSSQYSTYPAFVKATSWTFKVISCTNCRKLKEKQKKTMLVQPHSENVSLWQQEPRSIAFSFPTRPIRRKLTVLKRASWRRGSLQQPVSLISCILLQETPCPSVGWWRFLPHLTQTHTNRPERPKGAKDEVKSARRAPNYKLGPGGPLNF